MKKLVARIRKAEAREDILIKHEDHVKENSFRPVTPPLTPWQKEVREGWRIEEGLFSLVQEMGYEKAEDLGLGDLHWEAEAERFNPLSFGGVTENLQIFDSEEEETLMALLS